MKKIGVLGAGLTGLSVAAKLNSIGYDTTIFEKQSRIGGLCKTDNIDGYTYDLHGGHVFNSKFPNVKDWVFDHLPKEEWEYSVRDSRIQYNDNEISYPFELSLSELPVDEAVSCILDYISEKGEKPDNFYEWLIWKFGESIANKYMIPYNSKIWGCDLHELSIDWVDGKMPIPSNEEILKAALTKDYSERNMPHSTFYYPQVNGIESLIKKISKNLLKINLSYDIERIWHNGKSWVINDISGFDQIIWTIPLPFVSNLIVDTPLDVSMASQNLRWNSITTFLFKSDSKSTVSWKYFPNKELPYHRVVYQGNLADKTCPPGNGSYTVEMIGKHKPEELKNYFPLENFLGHSFTEYAYVLYDLKHSTNVQKITKYLNSIGIIPLGRFGEWQYYNMDVCIKRAIDCASHINLHE